MENLDELNYNPKHENSKPANGQDLFSERDVWQNNKLSSTKKWLKVGARGYTFTPLIKC